MLDWDVPPPAGGAPSPGRPATRGAHRLPIEEDGGEGDQRKTCSVFLWNLFHEGSHWIESVFIVLDKGDRSSLVSFKTVSW